MAKAGVKGFADRRTTACRSRGNFEGAAVNPQVGTFFSRGRGIRLFAIPSWKSDGSESRPYLATETLARLARSLRVPSHVPDPSLQRIAQGGYRLDRHSCRLGPCPARSW